MHCPQCGTALEQDAKFCENCGAKVDQAQASAQGAVNQQPNQFNQATQQPNNQFQQPVQGQGQPNPNQPVQPAQPNQYVEQTKEISKNYLNFVPNALKHPFVASQQVNETTDRINGIITLVLFALFLPLYSYTLAKKVSGDYFEIPFFDFVIKPFLIFAIFFAVLVAVKFGVSKLMNSQLSFFNVLTRFGTLMVVPTAVLLVSFLFLLLSINTFSAILLAVAIGLTSIASIATLFSVKSTTQGGLDVVYGIIITNAAMVIILLIIGDSILGNLIEQLEDSFYYGF